MYVFYGYFIQMLFFVSFLLLLFILLYAHCLSFFRVLWPMDLTSVDCINRLRVGLASELAQSVRDFTRDLMLYEEWSQSSNPVSPSSVMLLGSCCIPQSTATIASCGSLHRDTFSRFRQYELFWFLRSRIETVPFCSKPWESMASLAVSIFIFENKTFTNFPLNYPIWMHHIFPGRS